MKKNTESHLATDRGRKTTTLLWKILTGHVWSFCKYFPETSIVMQGQAKVKAIAGTNMRIKWCEEGTWVGKNNKLYHCTLVHEYVLEKGQLRVYSGPETQTLLHTFSLHSFTRFPFSMQHTHVCGQDTYDCTWVFLSPGSFEIQYIVRGPKKEYRIQALYTANA